MVSVEGTCPLMTLKVTLFCEFLYYQSTSFKLCYEWYLTPNKLFPPDQWLLAAKCACLYYVCEACEVVGRETVLRPLGLYCPTVASCGLSTVLEQSREDGAPYSVMSSALQ